MLNHYFYYFAIIAKMLRDRVKSLLLIFFLTIFFCMSDGQVWAANLVGGGGGGSTPGLHNLQNTTSTNLIAILGGMLSWAIHLLLFASGAFTVIIIVIGAIKFILAAGDIKATQSAKATITFGIVGFVVILLAVLIVQIVGTTLGDTNLTIINVG